MGFDVEVYTLYNQPEDKMGSKAELSLLKNLGKKNKVEIVGDVRVTRFTNTPSLLANLSMRRAELVHDHTIGWIPATVAPFFTKNHVFTLHNAGLFPNRGNIVSLNLVREVLSRCNQIITRTHFTKKAFSKLADIRKFTVIRAPIDYKFWSNPKGGEEFRSQWNISEELITTVANLVPVKNVETLIQAFQLIKKELPKAKLAVVGGDTDPRYAHTLKRKSIELGFKGDVLFLGRMNRNDISKVLDASDVFTMASLYENNPMAACEAAAAGIPLVMPDLPTVREILHGCSLFNEATNYIALAENIKLCLTDENISSSLSKVGKERVREFDTEIFKLRTREVYEKVISHEHISMNK